MRGDGLLVGVEFVADRSSPTLFDADKKIGPRIAAAKGAVEAVAAEL